MKIQIKGMSCASCASEIENSLNRINGINCSVNYATESAYIKEYQQEQTEEIFKTITDLGYSIVTLNNETNNNHEKSDDLKKFAISFSLSICLFSLAMWPLISWPNQKINWLLQLACATPIWIWIGFKFQKSVWHLLKTGKSNMNTLIGIGTSAAFIYSFFVTIFTDLSISLGLQQKVYFEAVGFIISFVFLGQYFEEKAKRKTKESLNSLFQLSAKSATIIDDNGNTSTLAIDKISVNDIIRVKPGEKFPVDGVVIKGTSSVNESMISGEPIPVLKEVGSSIFAGTINEDSTIDYQSKKVGNDTFLAQIIQYVEMAQSNKPQIQRYADKVSSIFTPAVIAISILTFLLWFFLGPEPKWGYSISNFIAVLVIACPCALGLATPTAVVVATGVATLKGLLISGGDVLEKATSINAIVFDKTGTLTEGKPVVISLKSSIPQEEVLKMTASIEQFSEHPLSKALIAEAEKFSIKMEEPDEFEVVKGMGIIASFENKKIHIGNETLFSKEHIELDPSLKNDLIGTQVLVSQNKTHIATFIIGDKVKSSAKKTIENLKAQGLTTWMITGDNEAIAKEVSNQLGIDHFYAKTLPIEKADRIKEIQSKGFKVAMIGDGINDAPALTQADLSLAMGTGTDVAINSSDATIVNGDIHKVVHFIQLANGTMKIIKQNLFLSMIYNTVLIPIAAGILYLFDGPMLPPILASIAMALSSISVVSNSLRIKGYAQ